MKTMHTGTYYNPRTHEYWAVVVKGEEPPRLLATIAEEVVAHWPEGQRRRAAARLMPWDRIINADVPVEDVVAMITGAYDVLGV